MVAVIGIIPIRSLDNAAGRVTVTGHCEVRFVKTARHIRTPEYWLRSLLYTVLGDFYTDNGLGFPIDSPGPKLIFPMFQLDTIYDRLTML